MSIYRRLNPKLLIQAGVGLDLLYWTNMSNISLTEPKKIEISNLVEAKLT